MAAASRMSLKLLIDTKSQRVLFAEADKKAVDFLFRILTLPMGTVIRLLRKQQMVGCLGNLYDSVENLSQTYIQPNQTKEILLKPKIPLDATTNFSSPLLALPHQDHQETFEKVISGYRCNNVSYYSNQCVMYFSDDPRAICPQCRNVMSAKMKYVSPPPGPKNYKQQTGGGGGGDGGEVEGGFVKGVVTYMVMNDLVVKPMSTISSIALLNKFNVKEVGALEERVVDLGIKEALNLLKTSMESKTVLTTVFLKNIVGK